MRAIGRADLDERGAARGHDVGDAEAAPDLDEFAATDDRLAAGGEGLQGEHECGGAVVDHQCILSAREFSEQRGAVHVAAAACAERDIVFEGGRRAGDLGDRLERRRSEGRAAQIGVQHDTRAVDRGPQ